MAEAWRPLLTGDEAARARAAVDAIAEALRAHAPSDDPDELSLARGEPGVALFLAYLARAGGDEALAAEARARLDAVVERVLEAPGSPHLWSGLAGVAWVQEHLSPTPADAPGDEDACAEIDDFVLQLVEEQPIAEARFELYRGLAGLAVYALERRARPGARACLDAVAARLVAMATCDERGARWFTTRVRLPGGDEVQWPDGYHSMGLAHGGPGVMAVLAALHARGLAPAGTAELLGEALRWLWDQRLPPGAPSVFPSILEPPTPARTAWCYGDPGLAVMFHASGEALGDEVWRARGIELGRAVATRSLAASTISDAQLCHGAAGVGHMLNRLAQRTADPALAEGARRWLRQALAFRREGTGVAGFVTDEMDERIVEHRGVLDGAAGIGLAFLAAITPLEPAWDRLFVLSSAP